MTLEGPFQFYDSMLKQEKSTAHALILCLSHVAEFTPDKTPVWLGMGVRQEAWPKEGCLELAPGTKEEEP